MKGLFWGTRGENAAAPGPRTSLGLGILSLFVSFCEGNLRLSDAIIRRHMPGAAYEFVRTAPSAVTTAWGVKWNEMQIARDVLQNFYDANREHLEDVRVNLNERDVRIEGAADF